MTQPSKRIPPDEALRMVRHTAQPADPRAIPLLHAVGLRLAEDVCKRAKPGQAIGMLSYTLKIE